MATQRVVCGPQLDLAAMMDIAPRGARCTCGEPAPVTVAGAPCCVDCATIIARPDRSPPRRKASAPPRSRKAPSPAVDDVRYFGGKNHLYRQLINLIPRHLRFVELFAGSAAVSRHLARDVAEALVVELDTERVRWLQARRELAGHRVVGGDAFEVLEKALAIKDGWLRWGEDTVVFADPPYPIPDRRDARARYTCELDESQHRRLVELLRRLAGDGVRVLVCGHPWGLYPAAFADWKRHEFPVGLRNGRAGVECVWTSFDDPFPLHDYRYFGANKQVRQDLRRRIERQLDMFRAMDRHHRAAILRELVATFPREASAGARAD